MHRTCAIVGLSLGAAFSLACDGDNGLGSSGSAASIAVFSGNDQSAPVGSPLVNPLVVRVTDRSNRLVINERVAFRVTSGGGRVLGDGNAITNGRGEASAFLVLGATIGANSVSATVGSFAPATFAATATAGAAARLVLASGDGQAGGLGTPLTNPLVVRTTDDFGNTVANVVVTFAISSGSGTLSAPTATSNALGLALAVLTLTDVGVSTVTATSASVPAQSVVFSASTGPTLVGQITVPQGVPYAFAGTAGVGGQMSLAGGRPKSAVSDAKGDAGSRSAEQVSALTAEEVSSRISARGRIVVTYKPEAFNLPTTARSYTSALLREDAVALYRSAVAPYVDARLVTARAMSPVIGAVLLQAMPGRDPNEIMAQIRRDPRVMTVEEDGVMYAAHEGRIAGPSPGLAQFLSNKVPSLSKLPPLDELVRVRPGFAARNSETYPSDPLTYQQAWHYWMVGAPRAWKVSQGSPQVRVAIIDTGARPDHPALAGMISPAMDHFDFTDGTTNAFGSPQPICGGGTFSTVRGTETELALPRNMAQDPLQLFLASTSAQCWTRDNAGSHGSHVSGTIAGAANDGVGGTGLNWSVTLMIMRVLGVTGAGFTFDVAQGILFAAGLPATYMGAPFGTTVMSTAPAHFANMSLSGSGQSAVRDNAVAAASAAGLLIFAAAGNNAGNAANAHPAANPLVFTVGALDPFWGLASYTNIGVPVDGAGPGGDFRLGSTAGVLSSTWNYQTSSPTFSYYQGTSMATPHATGTAALVKAANPGLTTAQVRTRMEQGAIDLGPTGRDNRTGFGAINAFNSMTATRGPSAVTTVRAINATTGVLVRSTPVGADGRFTFANLAAGNYYLVAGQDESNDGLQGIPGRRFNWFGTGPMVPFAMSGAAVKNVGFSLSPPVESEPNDDLTQAQHLVVDSWLAGHVGPPDGKDLYAFLVPAAGTYTVETSGNIGACGQGVDVDTIIRLLGTTGTELAINDDTAFPVASYPGLRCSRITMELQPGRYFVEVTPFSIGAGTYRLHIRSGT